MPKNKRSAMRAMKRGHAVVHDSDLFGPMLLRRTGRGGWETFFGGAEFKGKPVPARGGIVPAGKPAATVNQRKKPRSIHGVFVTNSQKRFGRNGRRIIYPLD